MHHRHFSHASELTAPRTEREDLKAAGCLCVI